VKQLDQDSEYLDSPRVLAQLNGHYKMAHYAFIDENNIVVEVIPGKDENEGDLDWEKHYSEIRGLLCKRTSYNTYKGIHQFGKTPFRKNYAGPGYTYDSVLDAFIPPQPFASWILDQDTCHWKAPVEKPQDGKIYSWNESTTSWEEVVP
jgi:hypothetical protein